MLLIIKMKKIKKTFAVRRRTAKKPAARQSPACARQRHAARQSCFAARQRAAHGKGARIRHLVGHTSPHI